MPSRGSILERLQAAAAEATDRAARLHEYADLAEQLGDEGVAQLLAAVGEPPANPKHPVGRAAIRRITAERPGIWTLKEIRTELKRRGWYTGEKSLYNSIKRLHDINGECRRLDLGLYEFGARNDA